MQNRLKAATPPLAENHHVIDAGPEVLSGERVSVCMCCVHVGGNELNAACPTGTASVVTEDLHGLKIKNIPQSINIRKRRVS